MATSSSTCIGICVRRDLRRVPFLVTLMLFFFGAQVLGFDLSPLTIALIVSTAFVAEIIRGGLASVRPARSKPPP